MTEAEELELLELEEQAAKAKGAPTPTPTAAQPAQAAQVPDAGRGEAFLRGGAQGATFALGDEAQGAVQATTPTNPSGLEAMLSPAAALQWVADRTSGISDQQRASATQVDAERAQRLAQEGPGARLRRLVTNYQQSRDSARREDTAAKDAHGGYYLGGNLAGAALTAPLVPGGAAMTAGQAAIQGAKLGAAAGLGGSEADLTQGDVGGALEDTALGAGLGALTGAAVQQLPRVAGAGLQKLRELGESVAARLGRRVLQGGSDTLAKGQAIPDEMVLDAIRRGIVKFGSTTKGALGRASAEADKAGALYGSILDELQKAGVQGPNAHRLAVEVTQDAAQRSLEHPASAGPEVMKRFAEALGEQYQPGAADMPLGLAETMKRNLQGDASKLYEAARRGLLPEGENLAEGKLAIAAKMKTAIEDAVQRQASKAPAEAAAFQPVKGEAAALLRLRSALEKGVAKTQNRGPVGLLDMLSGVAGAAAKGPLGIAAVPASMLLRAVGPSSGATTGMAVSELATALRGLPAAAERELPGVGRAALTAGTGAAEGLQEAITQALRGKKLSPVEEEQLRRQLTQAEALRQ